MDVLEKLLEQEWFIQLVGAVALVVIGYVQTTKHWQRAKEFKVDQLYLFARAAVEETYSEYVRAIVKGREDGTLTKEERAVAQDAALSTLIRISATQGINAVKLVSEAVLRSLINQSVADIKSERKGQTATQA